MYSFEETVFLWVKEFVEVELSKQWAKENDVEDIDLCINNRMGFEYIDNYLTRNIVMCVGEQRNMLEAIVNTYKYYIIDRNDFLSRIDETRSMIRSCVNGMYTVEDGEGYEEADLAYELQSLNDALTNQDRVYCERVSKMVPIIKEFCYTRDLCIETKSAPRSSAHVGQLQAV
jgi:hypothetical protein